jgi:hypothetical protein
VRDKIGCGGDQPATAQWRFAPNISEIHFNDHGNEFACDRIFR